MQREFLEPEPDLLILKARHDGSINELWRATEPIFQTLKDENPKLLTISKVYREPSCFDTTKRSLIR